MGDARGKFFPNHITKTSWGAWLPKGNLDAVSNGRGKKWILAKKPTHVRDRTALRFQAQMAVDIDTLNKD